MGLFAENFDGMEIVVNEGKFSGTFEDQPARIDDEFYVLVRARNKGAAISETKSGDLKRVNVYAISEAVRVDEKEALKLAISKNMQMALPGGLDLDDDDEEL